MGTLNESPIAYEPDALPMPRACRSKIHCVLLDVIGLCEGNTTSKTNRSTIITGINIEKDQYSIELVHAVLVKVPAPVPTEDLRCAADNTLGKLYVDRT